LDQQDAAGERGLDLRGCERGEEVLGFFFGGEEVEAFFKEKKKTLLKTSLLNPSTQQADLALLRSLGVMPCAFSVKTSGRSSASGVRFSPGVTGVDDGALGSGSSGAKCRLVPWAENSAPVLLVPVPVRKGGFVRFGLVSGSGEREREKSAAGSLFLPFSTTTKKTFAKIQEDSGGVSGSGGGGFGSDDGLLSSDGGGGWTSSGGAGKDALLFRNGVAASILGGGNGERSEKPATTAALAVVRSSNSVSSSSSSSLSSSSSSSASPPDVFVSCDGSSSSSASTLLLSVPRFGLWALQALAVDAVGNEGEPVACALSFEREAGGLFALSPLAIGAIAVGVVLLVGGAAVGCWLRKRR